MGRVSKYKKIKAIDPYSKQRNKSFSASQTMTGYGFGFGSGGEDMLRQKKMEKKAQKQQRNNVKNKTKKKQSNNNKLFFDIPPEDKEDDFDMANLTVVRHENNKTKNAAKNFTFSIIESDTKNPTPPVIDSKHTFELANQELQKELKNSRLLKINPQSSSTNDNNNNNNKLHGRLEGESMKAFTRRINQETAMILKQSLSNNNGSVRHLKQSNPVKYEKKVNFLNRKKKRMHTPVQTGEIDNDMTTRNERRTENKTILIAGENAVQRQAAGNLLHDQVERPPCFSVLPRGAKSSNATSSSTSATTKGELITKEQKSKELEQYRAKVQAQYALMKAKQRNAY